MSLINHLNPPAAQGLIIRIREGEKTLSLDYKQATAEHQRSLWWGTAVGYRAMQVAALALSQKTLWSRDNLSVVSAHPGPGVLDSINFVTRCGDRNRLTVLQNAHCENRCNSEMKFEWWVSDGLQSAHVMLREDFVPQDFYQLIDRRVYEETRADDDQLFELYKVNLSSQIWVEDLQDSFSVAYESSLAPGELPRHHAWVDKLLANETPATS